jgi:hypothetical protein
MALSKKDLTVRWKPVKIYVQVEKGFLSPEPGFFG